MAIKVNGTTVIDDSRNISNVGTVTATSFSGNGSALTGIDTSPPTTKGAVGTYAFLYRDVRTPVTAGTTYPASELWFAALLAFDSAPSQFGSTWYSTTEPTRSTAGTWRSMTTSQGNTRAAGVFLRIS